MLYRLLFQRQLQAQTRIFCILLLVSTFVTSILIQPWLTKRWEDYKKELEIKADIASKMSEAIAYQLASSIASTSRQKKENTVAEADDHFEDIKK
jgi:hypothetical protein